MELTGSGGTSPVKGKHRRSAVRLSDGMDSPVILRDIGALVFIGVGIRSSKRKESDMNATTVAVDLAKSVFQLAVADEHWRVVETQRLTRT